MSDKWTHAEGMTSKEAFEYVDKLETALAPFADVWRLMVDEDENFNPVTDQTLYRRAWYALSVR